MFWQEEIIFGWVQKEGMNWCYNGASHLRLVLFLSVVPCALPTHSQLLVPPSVQNAMNSQNMQV